MKGDFSNSSVTFFLAVRVQGVCPKFRRETEGGRIFEVTSAFEDCGTAVEWVKRTHPIHFKTLFYKRILHKYMNIN